MGEINKSMKKTKLAIAISAVLTIAAGQVSAQQSEDGDIEEVVVKGIRGSLQAALDIKRDTSGVMDAISAEDIGKFPDTNLAESLQRITGVSVNRVEGEGSEVTIRGFGGQFNLVTLNGRQPIPGRCSSASMSTQILAIHAHLTFQILRPRAYRACRCTKPAGPGSRPVASAAQSMFKPSGRWMWVISFPLAPKPLTTVVATALRQSLVVWAAGRMTQVHSV